MKYDYLFHLPTINSNNFFFFLTLLCSEKLRAFSITSHSCSIADTPGGESFKMFHGTEKICVFFLVLGITSLGDVGERKTN